MSGKDSEEYARLAETRTGRQEIFSGKVVRLVRDTVRLPDGKETGREVILHNGAVCVAALRDGKILLVRQFRYPFGQVIWEVPAGKLDFPGEDHLEAAKRELSEETGYTAENFRFIGEFYGSPAILGERIYMYLATGLKAGKRHLDDDEFLDVFEIPFEEAVKMIARGEIPDGKTQAAVLKTALLLGRDEPGSPISDL